MDAGARPLRQKISRVFSRPEKGVRYVLVIYLGVILLGASTHLHVYFCEALKIIFLLVLDVSAANGWKSERGGGYYPYCLWLHLLLAWKEGG